MRVSPPRHLLLQFSGPVTASTLAAIRKAGAIPLRLVPDTAVAVAAPAGFSPSSIDGARWAGELQPADRISPDTAADLDVPFPKHALTIVEFHPDISAEAVAQSLEGARASRVGLSGLPQSAALIATDALVIRRLAGLDAVAWIYPAAADLEWTPTAICEGLIRPEGVIANYAAMGDGWDGPGRGAVRLTYFLERPSADLPQYRQREELRRAMAEWSVHAAIGWGEAAGSSAKASVNILWGGVAHGDGFPFTPGVLAHAFYPAPTAPEPIAGDIHFNDTLKWGTDDPRRWDIFSVALHELGHTLGLVHSSDPDSVMYPMYRAAVNGLSPADIEAVRSIYAPAAPETLPAGWTPSAVGGDGGALATDEGGGRFMLQSSGSDIWNRADEFSFVSRVLAGDGDVVARVDALEGTHRWSKAGVMVRASLEEDSAHAFALVSAARGVALQRRRVNGGLSASTDGAAGTAPQWLWLSRRGNRLHAFTARDGEGWRLIGSDDIALPHEVFVGLAVTNHERNGVATATFSNVSVTRVSDAGWTAADVGAVGRKGSESLGGSQLRVRGAGSDVWDRADAFRFVWQRVDGDLDMVARLLSVQNTRAWSKAGVMIRSGTGVGAAHAFLLGSAGKGYAFQRRRETGGESSHTAVGTSATPLWLKLSRRGSTVAAYHSTDGITWTLAGSDTIALDQTVLVGLAVSSHTTHAAAEAVFDNVVVSVPVK